MLPGKTRLSAGEPLPADLPIPVTLAARRQGHHRHQRCFCSVQTLRFVCCGIYRSPRIGVNHRLIWCALTRRDDVTMRRRSRGARIRLKKSKPNCRGLFHPLQITWRLQNRPIPLNASNYFSGLRYKVLGYTPSSGRITSVGKKWCNFLWSSVHRLAALNMASPHPSPKRRQQ